MKDLVERNRVCGHRLLDEAEEKLSATPGPATIESECELVQVVIEMFVADCPLVGTHQPSFKEGDHAVNLREQLRRGFLYPFHPLERRRQ